MNPDFRLLSIACLAGVLLTFGCASTSPDPDFDAGQADPAPVVEKSEPKAELALDAPGAPELAPVYFDTDRALLRTDARKTLQRYASAILKHPEWGVVRIEGHCDERGTEEYNLALGGRRAAAVQRYLRELGVPPARLVTHTFGEARPAVAGSGEAAWQKNRRTELKSEARDSAQAR